MTPEFAQIHTCILRDPNINGLRPESGWNWVRLIVLAKTNKDLGRIGTVVEAAYVLHVTVESIQQTILDLDGRIDERDGQLYIRDWADWQTLTNKERQARFDAAHHDDGQRPVTDGNDRQRPVTPGNGENDKGKGREGNVTGTPHGADAPRWEPVTAWAVSRFGEPATLKADGTLKAWVGAVCRAIGPSAENDPLAAAGMLDSFYRANERDGSWRYVTTANVAERIGKWLAERDKARRVASSPVGLGACVSQGGGA